VKLQIREVFISVAIITDAHHRLLWTWNDRWGCFCLPMTKQRRFPGASEAPHVAAVRAAAEALGVPAEVGDPFQPGPSLEISQATGEPKTYHHAVFPARPHPAMVKQIRLPRGHLWLTPHDSLRGGFAPLSENSLAIVSALVDKEGLPDGAPPRDDFHDPV
jgi:hypothetical protein